MPTVEQLREYFDAVREGLVLDPTTKYALDVTGKRVLAGPWVRLACQRHLDDLKREDITWSPKTAQRALDFFPDMLVLPGDPGDQAGPLEERESAASSPFVLQPWQQFIVGSLFGWKAADGWRRFRTAYVEIGKGNGKSPLAGGIGIYTMIADKEAAAEVYAAATKFDQAKILWTDASRMVRSSPILSGIIVPRVNLLVHPRSYSVFKPMSSDKKGLSGPRVHCGLIDELHEHPDATVVNMVRAGTKGRKQALIFEITNSGYDKNSVCYQHHDLTLRILQGRAENDSWFGYVCALDPGDDWENDEACWIKANPNLGVSISKKYLRELVDEAKGMPSKQSIVQRLNFCMWVGSADPWIGEDKWKKCVVESARINWAALKDVPCWAAVDLSSRRDLTAIAVVWKLDEGALGRVFYFMPEDALDQSVKDDKVPYDVWAREGWITLTPGNLVDYAFVAHKLIELDSEFNLTEVAFDPWRIKYLQKELNDANADIKLRQHGQQFTGGKSEEIIWMPTSLETFEKMILEGRYWVEDSPVTTMCVANTVTRSDPAGNRKFEKDKATGRMDGTVAQAMAIGLAYEVVVKDDGPSIYESRDMTIVKTTENA